MSQEFGTCTYAEEINIKMPLFLMHRRSGDLKHISTRFLQITTLDSCRLHNTITLLWE